MMKQVVTMLAMWTLALCMCACTVTQFEGQGAENTQPLTWQEQYDMGVRYLSEGNYEKAILAFTAAVEIDPKRVPAYVGRGDAYVLSGKTEESLAVAKTDYEKAIELDETSSDAYRGLADVYIRQGDVKKALEILWQGYKITHTYELLDLIERTQNQIDAEKDAWIFTDNMVEPKELAIGGIPFWEAKIERVSELFPNDDEMKDNSLIISDDGIQYTQYSNRVSVVIAHQKSVTQMLNSINFSAQKNYSAAANYEELRGIRFGFSRQLVLKELGLTDDGVEFCLSLEPGKILRFICVEGIWTEDIESAGSTSPGGKIEFIWSNFNSDQELMLGLHFDETDVLARIEYVFCDDMGY